MANSILSTLTFLVAAFISLTLSASTAPPFNILVLPSSPSTPSSSPLYLTSTGTTTSTRSAAAVCWLSYTSELFCANFHTAIGLPSSSEVTKVTTCTAECVGTKGWSVDPESFELSWGGAGFLYKGGDGTAWAAFGGGVEEAVGATLKAAFD